mgnify:CR=1 FL=1
MKRIIIIFVLSVFLLGANAQEPGNNLRKSLSVIKQEFPELRYIKTDAKGDEYEDGYPEEGVATFFYFRNGYVIEEAMILQDTNDFPYEWYKSQVHAFKSKNNYLQYIPKSGHNTFVYSYFNIELIYVEENGKNTALIVYTLRNNKQSQSNPKPSNSQSGNTYRKQYPTPNDWYQVQTTRNKADVHGMKEVCLVKATGNIPIFGSATYGECFKKALDKMKKKAFRKNGKVILITYDSGDGWGWQSAKVEGIVYK